MKSQLITKNIWQMISAVAKRARTTSHIAVGYFGQGGAKMLPLSRGSVVVVDASEIAVKSGQTCPAELLKLYNKGVRIFSSPNLHAKVYVLGSSLFIGSANVSGRSRDVLTEVVFTTNDRNSVREAKEFVKSLCSIELGPERLKALQKIYRPPLILGRSPKSMKISESERENISRLHVFNLCMYRYTDEEERQAAIGRREAGKKRINKKRHTVKQIHWPGKFSAQEGDAILQIMEERNEIYVSPPGTLISIRKCNEDNKSYSFLYVETPEGNRKNLKWVMKHIPKKDRNALKRNGRLSKHLAERIFQLWN